MYLLFQNPKATDDDLKEIIHRKYDLNEKTSQYPIGIIARILSKLVIKTEMDLKWLTERTKHPLQPDIADKPQI